MQSSRLFQPRLLPIYRLRRHGVAGAARPPCPRSGAARTDRQGADTGQFAAAGLGVDATHGKHVDPRTLEEMLRSYVCNVEVHNRLRRAAAAAFPDDPTGVVAGIFAGRLE